MSGHLKTTRYSATSHATVCSNHCREPIKCRVEDISVSNWFLPTAVVTSCTVTSNCSFLLSNYDFLKISQLKLLSMIVMAKKDLSHLKSWKAWILNIASYCAIWNSWSDVQPVARKCAYYIAAPTEPIGEK